MPEPTAQRHPRPPAWLLGGLLALCAACSDPTTPAGSALQIDLQSAAPEVAVPLRVAVVAPTATESVSLRLESHPTGATLSGQTTAPLLDGRAEFEVTLDRPGRGFVITAETTESSGSSLPFDVSARFQSVAVGVNAACALTTLGHGYCWGANGLGQLGVGFAGNELTRPTPVVGEHVFAQITVGKDNVTNETFICALPGDGLPLCWGSNLGGHLGRGSVSTVGATPGPVVGVPPLTQVSAGGSFACGLDDSARVVCWGGSLGPTPTPIPLPGPARLVRAGRFGDACAVLDDGTGYCWRGLAPELVPGPVRFRVIDSGVSARCGVDENDRGYCWGSNLSGALGTGRFQQDESAPAPVAGDHTWTSIETSGFGTCGLRRDGTAMCWGRLAATQGPWSDVPILVPGLPTGLRQLSVGQERVCAVDSDGALWCWNGSLQPKRMPFP